MISKSFIMSLTIFRKGLGPALGLILFASTTCLAQESTAITTVYTGLLKGIGSGVGSDLDAWALSAIGISGSEETQLAAISAELQEIDADLKAINATLEEILNAIEEQTCTQLQTSLQAPVNNITALYNTYRSFLANAALSPPVPPTAADVLQWQSSVLSSIATDLNAIHNAVYATPNANVITQCAIATAAPYLTASPTYQTFFDDRPSYSQLADILNYYYGVQVQGATVLAEAYHLQACQLAALNDPNLHCDFATASTSTQSSEVTSLCDNPTDTDVRRACLSAQEAVTNPDTGTGMYERVEAWLLEAGAPYSTGEAPDDDPRKVISGGIGLLRNIDSSNTLDWSSSYAWLLPRDLLDFTNTSTVNGSTPFHCNGPLKSSSPCGPVGPYNANFNSAITYGGYSAWNAIRAAQLLQLFEPYNDKANGSFDYSGTAGDYLYSIGFSAAAKDNGMIVITYDTGKNQDTGFAALCFMDTAAPRDKAKQPWCDGIHGEVQGTDNLLNTNKNPWVQSGYLDSIASNPRFYEVEINTTNGHVKIAPGWFVQMSETGNFNQFHWPVINVSTLSCQNGKPHTNPGGLLSRCGDDLQGFVDALLPPPSTQATSAAYDVALSASAPDDNDGNAHFLALTSQRRGSTPSSVVAIQMDRSRVDSPGLEGGFLRLSFVNGDGFEIPRYSQSYRIQNQLEIMPLTEEFLLSQDSLPFDLEGRSGAGATFNCALDGNLSNAVEDCELDWPEEYFDDVDGVAWRSGAWVTTYDADSGRLYIDVSEDVLNGTRAWLVRFKGQGVFRNELAFYSREAAKELRDRSLAPTLVTFRGE